MKNLLRCLFKNNTCIYKVLINNKIMLVLIKVVLNKKLMTKITTGRRSDI